MSPAAPTPEVVNGVAAAVEEGEHVVDDEAAMMALMGFGGFDTTKGKQVAGQTAGAANIQVRRKYRQVMHKGRRGAKPPTGDEE